MKVGIFGGAFNPPHLGHILLAQYAVEQMNLERLYFVPVGAPPHKQIEGKFQPSIRSLMIQMAAAVIPPDDLETTLKKNHLFPNPDHLMFFTELYSHHYFQHVNFIYQVGNWEIENENSTGYTIDTLNIIKEENPDWELFLIIGADQAQVFDSWKDWQEIPKMVQVCVGGRFPHDFTVIQQNFPFMTPIPFPMIDVSSTHIRERLQQGKNIAFLVPSVIEVFLLHAQWK